VKGIDLVANLLYKSRLLLIIHAEQKLFTSSLSSSLCPISVERLVNAHLPRARRLRYHLFFTLLVVVIVLAIVTHL
jgi:hypothetical protein